MISIFYLCDFPLGCLQAQMIHYFQSFSPCIRVSQTQGLSAEVRSLAESICWVILTMQEQKLKSMQTVTPRLSLAMPCLFQRENKRQYCHVIRSTSIPLWCWISLSIFLIEHMKEEAHNIERESRMPIEYLFFHIWFFFQASNRKK